METCLDIARYAQNTFLNIYDFRNLLLDNEFKLTDMQIKILAQLSQRMKNTEIAERLNLTGDGVTYHLRQIYRKTSSRHVAHVVAIAFRYGLI